MSSRGYTRKSSNRIMLKGLSVESSSFNNEDGTNSIKKFFFNYIYAISTAADHKRRHDLS